MKICKKEQTKKHSNSDECVITEFPIEESSINMAAAKITGRYPKAGYAVNHIVKEMVYVQSGYGSFTLVGGEATLIEKGDVIFVEPGDKFFWDGDFTAAIACSPAFTIEQHEIVVG